MKLLFKYCLMISFGLLSFSFRDYQNFDPNAKVKAVFIYNFTRYFEWPEKMKKGNFIIHVVGSNVNLNVELNRMAASKQVGNQKIEIISGLTLDINSKSHILYLLNDASHLLKKVISRYKGTGTLILTEKNGLIKLGSAINFVVVDNKQKFEYSKKNAIKGGLKTSDELNGLAIVVN